MSSPSFSRRHLFRLGGGAVVLGLGACAGEHTRPSASAPGTLPPAAPGTTGGPATSASSTTQPVPAPTQAGPPTSATTASPARRLVVVQLQGGNDGLNTVVPVDGRYHDARPTIGIADADLVALRGRTDVALHPGLAPLAPAWEAGRLAIVRGIGFADPDRSHFVSMDRWWRADEPSAPGWLGRVLDDLAADPPPLYATALGGGAPMLSGAVRQPASVVNAAAFGFRGLSAANLAALATPAEEDPLRAAAQRAYAQAVEAVQAFARVTAAVADEGADIPDREGGATLSAGLTLAAELLAADEGTRIVVVSASGFDTHAGQVATQRTLLADLASGITAFSDAVEAAGIAEDVLLVTTSEFGRRVHENGSAGTDHGAGNTSLVLGRGVRGDVHGSLDLGDLLDGDVRPTVDPRTLFTACLDWLGADPAAVLGRRYDEAQLLR